MTPEELLARLVETADDLGAIAAAPSTRSQLTAACATGRLALDAAAVSVARLHDDSLVYEASDGQGAEQIVGTQMSIAEGVAGYVARTGQAMIVDQVQSDPRFARGVAESTGYVPTSLLVAPVVHTNGSVLGVISVLDRGAATGGSDALALATSIAAQAALLLPSVDATARLAPLMMEALAAAAGDDNDLADALRSLAHQEDSGANQEFAAIAALLAELRTLGPDARETVERVLADLLSLARPRRR